MVNKLSIIIIFAIAGFIISFFISVISGSYFITIFIKSLFSAIILGALGYLLFYLLEKFNNETSKESTNSKKYTVEKENKIYNKFNETKKESKIQNNLNKDNLYKTQEEKNDYNLNPSDQINLNEISESISYEDVFSKLNDDEKIEEKVDGRIIEERRKENTDETFKKSIIEEMKEEKDKENVEVDFSKNFQIIEGDSDLETNAISAEDAMKISATSKMSSIAGEVKGIDDKYIYFNKGSKIENKPEKIAKVIKEMLKNE